MNSLIRKILELYPNERLDLHFRNPFELLVASILAAQERDQKVNLCTKDLFRRFDSPEKFATARPEDLKSYISRINFWNKKARVIIEASRQILEMFGGRVPDSCDELMKIRGVGSKTANMVVGGAFGKPAVIVDTHFMRVASRLGIVQKGSKAEEVERRIRELVPESRLTSFSLAMIRHGKTVCRARNPNCETCGLNEMCAFYADQQKTKRKERWKKTD